MDRLKEQIRKIFGMDKATVVRRIEVEAIHHFTIIRDKQHDYIYADGCKVSCEEDDSTGNLLDRLDYYRREYISDRLQTYGFKE